MKESEKEFRLDTLASLSGGLVRIRSEFKDARGLVDEIVMQGEKHTDMTTDEGRLLQKLEAAQKAYEDALKGIKQHLGRIRTRIEKETPDAAN